MLFIIIFIFILLLLTWWLIRWQQVKSYWAARNVPHEPPHPVLGSLTFLQKENPSLFVDYSTDILGEAAFGVSSNSITTGESAMREVTKDFMKFDWLRGLQWSCIFFFPELADFFRCKLFPKESLEILRKIYRTMVAERSKSQSISGKSKDLLDALMAMKIEAAAENEVYNEDLLFAQATLFVQAGFETTSSAITFAIYELAYNPEIQERLYREIVEAKQKMEGNELDGVVLSNLQYLNCVINETLRKYPSLGWLDRVSSQSYKVDDTLTVPAGTAVYVNVAGIQSDPQLFPKPEEFIPERFNTDNNNIKPFTFIPFGEGPRQCIGIRFGYQAIQFGLSAIILNFKLRPIEGSPLPNNCHIESKGFVYTADHPLHIQFVPRN